MLKMKADVLERLVGFKDVNRAAYVQAVEQAAGHFRNVKKVGEAELKALVRDLKGDWDEFSRKLLAAKN